MNKHEAIVMIKAVGTEFNRVRACLNGNEFAAGYNAAIMDMVRLFEQANIAPNYEAERNALLDVISTQREKIDAQEHEICDQHATIQKLLTHVNIAEVLGVATKKEDETKAQRKSSFWR